MKYNQVAYFTAKFRAFNGSLRTQALRFLTMNNAFFLKRISVKNLVLATVFLPLLGCASQKDFNGVYYVIPYQEEMVVLQNLKSRVLAYCYPSVEFSADDCAKSFEKQGFVRLKDIPRFPAQDDFLKADTYPTRRWRKNERAPRW